MSSHGDRPAGLTGVLCLATGVVCVAALLTPSVAVAQSAERRYRDAAVKLEALSNDPTTRLEDRLAVIGVFEAIARDHPRSPYGAAALWSAADMARTLYLDRADLDARQRAIADLQTLLEAYPATSLRSRALDALQALTTPSAVLAIDRIRRPAGVRIVVTLERPVAFRHQRLETPARVMVELLGAELPPANDVPDTFTFSSDLVRHIRVDRPARDRLRLVLDLEGVDHYYVVSDTKPYRLVIDCVRASAPVTLAEARPLPAPRPPSPALPAQPSWPRGTVVPTARAVVEAEVPLLARMTGLVLPVAAPPMGPSLNGTGGFSISRQLGLGASRVVIDPGHGGRDPGALHDGLSEADLVLDVALRLERIVSARDPSIDVLLTRRSDTYVPLEERTAIANRWEADLLVSIHANASRNEATRGIETYYLNFATTDEAEAVAARENATSVRTISSLPLLIKAIADDNKRQESKDFAAAIQDALVRGLRAPDIRNFGVKEAPFVVLIGARMPSILSEVAFMTNARDAELMADPGYRERIADALAMGLLDYLSALKKTQISARQVD